MKEEPCCCLIKAWTPFSAMALYKKLLAPEKPNRAKKITVKKSLSS
jgi:hypothetical protein